MAADLEHLHPIFRARIENACAKTGASILSGARSTVRQPQLFEAFQNGISEQSAFVKKASPQGTRLPAAGRAFGGREDPACRRAPVRSRGQHGAPAAEGEHERR